MAARTRRYIGILLAAGTLALPIHTAPSAQAQDEPGPFLDSATALRTADRQLARVRIRLGETDDPALSEGPPAPTSPPKTAASAGEAPATAARPSATPAPKPQAGVTVIVREGQSVWALARQYGISVDAIVAANELRSAELIRAGQRLLIPAAGKVVAPPRPRRPASPARTVTVRLRAGQTLWDLSQEYGVSVEEIAAANGLADPDTVKIGQRLQVPVGAAAQRRVPAAADRDDIVATAAVRLARTFLWPARGRLTSGFGWRRRRHHDGVDIAASRGAPITAARDGVVTFVGWYYSYGKTVIISHGGGLQTLYGHASALLVRQGQRVRQGELVARVGSTGRSTGPHLHFEVRINGRPVNPLKYL